MEIINLDSSDDDLGVSFGKIVDVNKERSIHVIESSPVSKRPISPLNKRQKVENYISDYKPLSVRKSVDDSLDLIDIESDEEDLLVSKPISPIKSKLNNLKDPNVRIKKSITSLTLGQHPLFTPESDPLSESSFIFQSPQPGSEKEDQVVGKTSSEVNETSKTSKTSSETSRETTREKSTGTSRETSIETTNKTTNKTQNKTQRKTQSKPNPIAIFAAGADIDQKLLEKVNIKKRDRAELMKEMKIIIPESIFEYVKYDLLKELFTDEVDDKGKCISSPNKGQNEGKSIETTKIIKIPSKSSIIRWKRYSEGRYDETKDLFIPCDPEDQQERATVLFYMIQDFLELDDSEIHKQVNPHTTLFLGNYHRHINEIKRKEESDYKNRVQSQQPTIASKKTSEIQEIEYRINKLQYQHNLNIVLLRSGDEMARYLVDLTYSLAFSKYDRYERNPELGNIIKPKTGHDDKSTFIKSLGNFKFMTEPKVELLHSYYDSLPKVYEKFKNGKKLGNDDDGRNLVPPSIEDAMKRFFTSNDENEIFYS